MSIAFRRLFFCAVGLFLALPLIVVAGVSINEKQTLAFPPQGFSLSLQLDDTAEAERMFRELSEGGRIVMPLEQTFWAARFGVVVDRFGIPWTINCEASGELA